MLPLVFIVAIIINVAIADRAPNALGPSCGLGRQHEEESSGAGGDGMS